MKCVVQWRKIGNCESSLKLKGTVVHGRDYGLLPKSLLILSKTFLILAVGRIPDVLKTRPPGPAASVIQNVYRLLRQDGWAKTF